jgi:hypothetical protein
MLPLLLISSIASRSSFLLTGFYWLPLTLSPSHYHTIDAAMPLLYPHLSGQTHPNLANLTSWPPHPVWLSVLFPFAHRLYNETRDRLMAWVLGVKLKKRKTRRVFWDMERFQGRLEIDWVDDNGNGVRGGELEDGDDGPAAAGAGAARNPNAQRGEENGVQIPGRLDPDEPPPLLDVLDNEAHPGPAAAAEGDANAEVDQLEEAEAATIRLTPYTFGRVIGGALILPTVSNFLGNLLLKIAIKWRLGGLQAFLGVTGRRAVGLGRGPVLIRAPELWKELDPV